MTFLVLSALTGFVVGALVHRAVFLRRLAEPDFVVASGDVVEAAISDTRPTALFRARVTGWTENRGRNRVVCTEIGTTANDWFVDPEHIKRILPRDACPACGQHVPERGYRAAEKPS